MRSFLFAISLAAFTLSSSAQSTASWDYLGKTGPAYWGKLDPSYQACSKGQQQSPIDLRGARLNKALQPIEFHYVAGPVTLVNDGRTVHVTVDPVSYIVVGGVRYTLLGYEFHHPSEHTIKNKLVDMEIDLIHRSADGKEVILGILLSETMGNPNAILASLWEHLPATAGKSDKIADMINTAGLLPADRGYWTYQGSQLTPPCAEGVKWFVFENQVSISRDQYSAFAKLYKVNTRPLQNPHGRKIEADE
jgi:carbonic anhydrase